MYFYLNSIFIKKSRIVYTPPPLLEGEGVESPTKFSKRGGLDRISIFRGGDHFSGGL